jgi:hypothetical protein
MTLLFFIMTLAFFIMTLQVFTMTLSFLIMTVPFFDHDSYKNRKAGSETSITTPITDVVHGIIKSVALGRKLVFIPKYWGLFSWWINFDHLISRRIYRLFLSRRVAKLRN